jgi:predicted ATPase/DNA-binding winged helix-turn-helix (wHTH) protein
MTTAFSFGQFHLDPPNALLTRGRQVVPLKPKAFDVLAHLVRQAGRLVPQEELIGAVWPDVIVGDSSLKSCVRQIRRALGDRVRSPRFIETVHRRGYRFIAPVTAGGGPAPHPAAPPPSTPARPAAEPARGPLLVGRAVELGRLCDRLTQAGSGRRQLVFVCGGPGSGKTALVEAFGRQVVGPAAELTVGQCFEQFGSGEAYLPVLEALGRLAGGPGRDRLARVLAARAPTWLAHLPALRTGAEAPAPPAASAPPERMLREMAEALERLTAEAPLVLVLEDLHWADYSTIDLVSALARRREPARLLLVATYRPVEAVLSGHPLRALKQDLQARGLCDELPLGLLSEGAVAEYLDARLPGGLPAEFAGLLHQRTEGHPLFLVSLVDDWLAQGVLVPGPDGWALKKDVLAGGVPASVRALIEKQLERLGRDELRVLEGASVAGVEFAAAAAAAAVEEDVVRAEEACEALARRHHFLVPKGAAEWPDGTVSARYRFGHELYHRVVAERVSDARRRLLHQRLGDRLETAHGEHPGEAVAGLALHFEQGRDPVRAVRYLEMAAHRAAGHYAHREAIDYLRRGLALVERLPEAERGPAELRLQVNLGVHLQAIQGFASPAARRAFGRARDLCRGVDQGVLLFPVLWGLWLYHKVRSDLPTARAMADELHALAERVGDAALALQAHQALAVTTLCLGEPAATVKHMERGSALYDPDRHHTHTFLFGQDPGVACRAFGAVALWLLGYPDRALAVSREAATRAHELAQPSSQALALHFAAMVRQCRREAAGARACAELALAIAADQGMSFWKAGGAVLRGWAVAEGGNPVEGVTLLRQGLDAWQATGSVTYRTYFLALLAEALAWAGRAADGLVLLDEGLALVEETSERLFEAELHRLRGELLRPSAPAEAEASFRQAVAVARRQGAKSLELRAAVSLARHSQDRTRRAAGRRALAETVGWFAEGFDTRDLQEAKALLEEAGG